MDIEEEEVNRVGKAVSPRRARGPNGVPPLRFGKSIAASLQSEAQKAPFNVCKQSSEGKRHACLRGLSLLDLMLMAHSRLELETRKES